MPKIGNRNFAKTKMKKIEQFYINGGEVLENSKVKFVKKEKYSDYRNNHVRVCHDAFIDYGGKILLFKRKNEPGKEEFWPIGGGVSRGQNLEKSLKMKVKNECGLKIDNIQLIGINRLLIGPTKNFEKGVDDIAFSYFAKGYGRIKLDKDHEEYILLSIEDFEEIKNSLNVYVSKMVEKCFEIQKKHEN